MTQTENLSLNLMEAADPVSVAALNANMEALDAAHTALSAALSDEVDTRAALSAAAYTPSNPPYVTGSYVGDGSTAQHITVGFRPSFVVIGGQAASDGADGSYYNAISGRSGKLGSYLMFDSTGFSVGSTSVPRLNTASRTYDYIAFQ